MTKKFLLFFFWISHVGMAQESSINAFVYHRFGDDRFPSTNIKLEQFEAHLKYLKDNDFEVIILSKALERLNQSSYPKTAVLTVDDGYKTFFENALPLLKQYGFSATLFVNTETVGTSDFMSWDELKSAENAGIEIGNHSHAHPYFLNKGSVSFQEDLATSEAIFKEHLGKIPKVYAFPYGEWNDEMANQLQDKGYLGAVAQNSGVMYAGSSLFHLPRFPMSEAYADLDGFVNKLKTLPLKITKMEESAIKEANPSINLEFQQKNLKIDQLQCFVQGAECQKSLQLAAEGIVKLNVRPDRDLKRRRTLFTITVPDNNGKWHWFSYSWVIPSINE
ncbi:MAG TPA: polysaccharide deacetylase family protein [Roseivirga sp.]